MTPINGARRVGAAGLGKQSFPGGNDNRVYPSKAVLNQDPSRARLRRQHHVEHLHRLGPAPLFHLLTDLDAGKPVWATVARYAARPCEFIRALGGDRFASSLWPIDGGRR
jgi:hypothetical protein